LGGRGGKGRVQKVLDFAQIFSVYAHMLTEQKDPWGEKCPEGRK
jgi:hypothetical protein